MLNQLFFRHFFTCCLIGLMLGCRTESLEDISLQAYLQRATTAHAEAVSLWDRLLFGETVTCAETLEAPPPLDADGDTQTQPTIQHLNAGLAHLELAVSIWEYECTLLRDTVPIEVVRSAQAALSAAQVEFDLAALTLETS